MNSLPLVSVVIAARPDEKEVLAARAAAAMDYPRERLEILVVRGRQPSVQRNYAVREARGEHIYFLDDDSVPAIGNLMRAVTILADENVAGIGGPNLCPAGATALEHSFSAVMGNKLAFGPSAARYRAYGERRDSSEKELILCNLLLRRSSFLAAGGFDEALYPNEENALMDTILVQGQRLVYDPEFVVQRHPRRTWRAFARMVFGYGRGRAEQFRLHPTVNSLLNFVPPVFCLYLAILAFLPFWGWIPLFLYAGLTLFAALLGPRHSSSRSWQIWVGLVATHVGYGAGFWKGLFTKLSWSELAPNRKVILERLNT